MTPTLRAVLELALVLGCLMFPAGALVVAALVYDWWHRLRGRELYTVVERRAGHILLDRPLTLGHGDRYEDCGRYIVVYRAGRRAA